jgi:hypothetical protein
MVAYFSCKLTKQIYAFFTAALLVFCLLGTHWIGLSHSISHAGFQNQAMVNAVVNAVANANAPASIDQSINHSSDVCHLFDALSLAGFVPSSHSNTELTLVSALDLQHSSNPSLRSFVSSSYRSRAPPTFIL